MNIFNHFHTKTLKYELLNKFLYKNINKLPKIKKIILNFSNKKFELKNLAASALVLELIANQKGILTKSKHSNILLKIRKGDPTGCKVILRKRKMLDFFFKILNETFPNQKNFNGFILTKKLQTNAFSCATDNAFSQLEINQHLFYNLSKLGITIITNSKTQQELIFTLRSFKFPLKQSEANITQMVECNLAKVEVKSSNLFICFLDKWSRGLRR